MDTKITNEVYRLTLFFPKKEPLRYKLRELADDVLANFISFSIKSNKQKIVSQDIEFLLETINSFLDIVQNQHWVKDSEILSLREAYSKIKEAIILLVGRTEDKLLLESKPVAPAVPIVKIDSVEEMPDRQKKILDILKRKDQVQIWEVKEAFPDVSKRTLRRDFKKLLQDNMVERIGEKNSTFYRVKVRT